MRNNHSRNMLSSSPFDSVLGNGLSGKVKNRVRIGEGGIKETPDSWADLKRRQERIARLKEAHKRNL